MTVVDVAVVGSGAVVQLYYEPALIGYEPVVSFLEGMARTIEWQRVAGFPVRSGFLQTRDHRADIRDVPMDGP